MQHTGLPLNEEYIEDTDYSSNMYVINPNDIKFEDVDNQILSAIIYIRNLELNCSFDFENCDYETKELWLLTYLKANLMLDKGIDQFNQCILNLVSNEIIFRESILSQDEIKIFRNRNQELIKDIIQFLISLDEVTFLLEKNKDNKLIEYDSYKGKIVKEKPVFYETIKHILIKYPIECDAIRLYYTNDYEHVLYEYIIKNISKEFGFYKAMLSLPSVRIFGLV